MRILTVNQAIDALNRVAKWRAHFAGWQLGTRSKADPESQAVRDINERLIINRCEISALAKLLIAARVITAEEFTIATGEEADGRSSESHDGEQRSVTERFTATRVLTDADGEPTVVSFLAVSADDYDRDMAALRATIDEMSAKLAAATKDAE